MSTRVARVVDALLEASVVGGFSKVGVSARRRLLAWGPLSRLDGTTVAITGATSGLGRAMAEGAASLGADVVLVVRDGARGASVAESLRAQHGRGVSVVVADLSDLAQVDAAAGELEACVRLDAVVHNAGALTPALTLTESGDELTFATHVLGPYLLTSRLLPALRRAPDPRIVVVTSGGMYTQPLDVGRLDRDDGGYVGSAAYARCKRAQVSLVDLHRARLASEGVLLAAYHPGWADTEGVRASLPGFRAMMRPILRSPDEGADTALWLLRAPRHEIGAAALYCDRAPRPLHRLSRTARSDTPAARAALDALCRARCGLEVDCR